MPGCRNRGLIGLFNSFHMTQLPEPAPSASGETVLACESAHYPEVIDLRTWAH